jgi:ssDNA-binding Zn-finger/Zn-ribbon topoisomerase 1
MLKGRNPFDWMRKRELEPKIYQVTCTKCNYTEKLELENEAVHVWNNPEVDHSQDPRAVSKLPELCPTCGAKLKKERIPVKLRY